MQNDISLWTKKVLVTFVFGVFIYLLYNLKSLVLVLVISGFLTLLIIPLIEKGRRYRVPEWITIISVYVLIFFLGSIVIGTLIPIIIDYVTDTVAIITNWVNTAQSTYATEGIKGFHFHPYLERIVLFVFGETNIEHTLDIIKQNAGNIQSIVTKQISNLTTWGLSIVSAVGGAVANWALIGIMTFLMILERREIGMFLLSLAPSRYDGILKSHYISVQNVCNSWIRATLVLSLSIFLVTYTWLYVLEFLLNSDLIGWALGIAPFSIEKKFTLALIWGIMEFIPYVGPLIALIPAAIIGLGISWKVSLAIVVLYLLIQRIENDVLVPYVMSKALNLSPILVFIVMIAWASLGGILGIILAVPLAWVTKVIYDEYREKKDTPMSVRKPGSITQKSTVTQRKASPEKKNIWQSKKKI
jgi:predicted PurR-regulated permease PerM